MCHSAACNRTRPIALCASCSDGVDLFRPWLGRHLQCQSYGMLGTRYFSNTQVIPRDVSQSQTSVPSRSIANPSKPPPGNTTTATPVFFSVGEYTVMVGCVTFSSHVHVLPATSLSFTVTVSSEPGAACASGISPGQI